MSREQGLGAPDLDYDSPRLARITVMSRELLDEARHAVLDDPSRRRLKQVAAASMHELDGALSAPLSAELHRFVLLPEGPTPSDAALRLVGAQLVGWLEGLVEGYAMMTLFAQIEDLKRTIGTLEP